MRWLKPGVFVGALVPLAVIAVSVAINQLGLLALALLTASLSCTPVKLATGWNWPLRLRRMLGLLAFFYASLHYCTYLFVDQGFDLAAILKDVLERQFIFAGFAAFVLMVPLAVTSTQKMVRRLGFQKWQKLHRLAYAAGPLAAFHFFMRVKADLREPLIYAGLIGLGLLLRLAKRPKVTAPLPAAGS